MPKLVEPNVYIIAESRICYDRVGGFDGFLAELGVQDWKTDAASDAEKLIEASGKLCYLSFSTDLNKNLTRVGMRSNQQYIQDGLVKTKHGSVLEHATVTIAFMNVSRVFTHELVRHRAGCAYSQVSGRYVRTDEIGYWMPKEIRENDASSELFAESFGFMEKMAKRLESIFGIDEMKDFTLKKKLTSAFRRILGNGQANHIIGTFNHRALRNIIELRTSAHAEEEIRLVFGKIFQLVSARYPAIYGDAVVQEVDGYPEVKFTYEKV